MQICKPSFELEEHGPRRPILFADNNLHTQGCFSYLFFAYS